MHKTVNELLQMVHDRIGMEKDSFARTGSLRRLSQFQQVIGDFKSLKVHIPKPAMTPEAKETLKNSRPASTQRSSRKRPPKKAEVVESEATSSVAYSKSEVKEKI